MRASSHSNSGQLGWVAMLGGFDNPQRLFGAAGGEQATRDLGRDLRDLSRSCVILRDEGVDVALRVGDVSQGQMDDAGPMAVLYLVLVNWTARRPADFPSFVLFKLFDWFFGQGDEALLQMF